MQQEDDIRGGHEAECLMDCFGGVVNLEPLKSLGGDKKLGSETGGAFWVLSEFKQNEKKVCPHCLTEIRVGYHKVCFFCKEKIRE